MAKSLNSLGTTLLSSVVAKLHFMMANASQSPFAAHTVSFQIHPEPQAGGNTVQWLVR
jgi:hypothetical protein